MKPFAIAWLALLTVILFTGCQSTPSVNWNARIGNFTYDQAVVELGPPDRQAKLADGRTVAKWMHRYSTGGSVVMVGIYQPGYVATSPGYYETTLILTFAPNNILATWSRR